MDNQGAFGTAATIMRDATRQTVDALRNCRKSGIVRCQNIGGPQLLEREDSEVLADSRIFCTDIIVQCFVATDAAGLGVGLVSPSAAEIEPSGGDISFAMGVQDALERPNMRASSY